MAHVQGEHPERASPSIPHTISPTYLKGSNKGLTVGPRQSVSLSLNSLKSFQDDAFTFKNNFFFFTCFS